MRSTQHSSILIACIVIGALALLGWSLYHVASAPPVRPVSLLVVAVAAALSLAAVGLLISGARDLRRRESAEHALRQSESRWRQMIEQLPAISWTVDRELRTTSSLGAGLKGIGLKPNEFVGRTVWEYFGTTDPTHRSIASHLSALEGVSSSYEYSGAGRHFKTSIEPLRGADGAIVGAIGLAHDITEMKQAYEALGLSMARYHDLVQDIDAIVWEADARDLRFTFASRQAESLLGYPVGRWIEDPGFWPSIIHPEDRARAEEALRAAAEDRRARHFEYRARAMDGRWLHLRHSVRAGENSAGEGEAVRGLIIDVTDQKMMERDAMRAQKLESIGILAGGIAHDFNNLLHGILGHLSLARMEGPVSLASAGHLEASEQAVHRAQELTGKLLTFARGGAPIRKVISIADLVREAVDFNLRGSRSRCVLELPGDLWNAEVDEVQINQVLSNLTINADQAMPRGGTLTVRAENIRLGNGGALPIGPGRFICIHFADQGVGIAEKDLPRVFDPYFTTKEKGAGLGLATTYSIVTRHQGHISVESEVGHGTTFSIYLPATPEAASPRAAVPVPPARGSGRVLVVDDEPMIRDLLRELLRHLGYQVECASDGAQAIGLYREAATDGSPFDLLILDLTIRGGMGGREAFDRIRALDPEVRAVVSSGYSNDPVMARYAEHGFKGVLSKPYTLEDLSQVLTRVIGEAS